jgi:hypothetical protein
MMDCIFFPSEEFMGGAAIANKFKKIPTNILELLRWRRRLKMIYFKRPAIIPAQMD